MRTKISNPEERQIVLLRLQKEITQGHRLIVGLSGPVGVGKTYFVSELLRLLGSSHSHSPTYALHHVYHISGVRPIHHWDLYRMRSFEELLQTGFWDQLTVSDLAFIEWPEIAIQDLQRLPEFVHLEFLPEQRSSEVDLEGVD